MANLRIVSDNAADRASSLVASSVAGLLAASNLQTSKKSSVWRAASMSARINALFASAEPVGFVGLPFCNLSPTATMRVRLTNEAAGSNLLAVNTDRCETWGNPPASIRYVLGPDGLFSGVVPITNSTANRWEFNIPANTHANGTVLVISWFQKTVTALGTTGQVINPVSWIGATAGAVSTVTGYPNGYSRKWCTVTITATASIQTLRFYLQGTVGADDIAACCWQFELGSTPTSYYPALLTFASRASAGTYLDVNGKIATAASGAGRQNYQYPSLVAVAPRLLVEPAATNEAFYSEQFENVVWGKGQATVTANSVSAPDAPDGARTMDKLIGTATLGGHYVLQAKGSYVAGDYVTTSVFAAAGEYDMITIGFAQAGAFSVTSYYATFNLLTGAFVASVGSPVGVSATPYPNGVWRFSLTHVATATGAASAIYIISDTDASGINKYTLLGDGTSGIYIWGGMIEKGSAPSSYIYTTSAAVTRAADNYSAAAGARPAFYMDWWQSYDYDSGAVLSCPAPARRPAGFTAAQAANAYAYGGGAYARLWMTEMTAMAVAIDIVDYANLQGYIEAGRLVVGKYWSPSKNASYGPSVVPDDTDENYRTAAGDLITDSGIKFRNMQFSLDHMSSADRKEFFDMARGAGKAYPLLISLFPESTDLALERDHMIYGKLATKAAVTIPSFSTYASTVEIEEM